MYSLREMRRIEKVREKIKNSWRGWMLAQVDYRDNLIGIVN